MFKTSLPTGNCLPLEYIDILHCSSSDPITTLNNNSSGYNGDIIIQKENFPNVNYFIMNHITL